MNERWAGYLGGVRLRRIRSGLLSNTTSIARPVRNALAVLADRSTVGPRRPGPDQPRYLLQKGPFTAHRVLRICLHLYDPPQTDPTRWASTQNPCTFCMIDTPRRRLAWAVPNR